uniref:Uncharacterized protein n=1 Tax=Oryza brachyantha TaxID=4533 RepID=J3L239_ORYBR
MILYSTTEAGISTNIHESLKQFDRIQSHLGRVFVTPSVSLSLVFHAHVSRTAKRC